MTVTIASLALALAMSALAWKMLREDRKRSTANVDALEGLAAEEHPFGGTLETVAPKPGAGLDDGFARKVVAVAPVEPPIPPRTEKSPGTVRPGTTVRFAERDPDEDLGDWVFRRRQDPGMNRSAPVSRPAEPSGFATSEAMFDTIGGTGTSSPRWLAFTAAGVLVAGVAAGLYWTHRQPGGAGTPAELSESRGSEVRPLELLSLRHSTDVDGAFTVTGLVQNPPGARTVRKVTAVVYLFDRDGNYFASGRAALDFVVLQPGDESPFVVHVAGAGRVTRYRVGFRFEDGGVASHVDRRGQLPGGTTGDAIGEPADSHRSASPITDSRRSQGRP